MAQRNIFLQHEPILRKVCKDVTDFSEHLWQLLDDMHETLDFAGGVGLAANQVGILQNIFILHNEGKRLEFINPKIIRAEGEAIGIEGCLSCPNEYGKVKRHQTVEVVALDRQGSEFSLVLQDLDARIVSHETDHLFGKLFKDIAFDLQKV
ncbi:MAG: peptide deformylase [Oscillospiraceae bacterium]|jgi:peptide deformylase|nr:peptide deformylase [Oscillospiraceae bacterium]